MKKTLKILIIICLVLSLHFNCCYALDLNLTETNNSSNIVNNTSASNVTTTNVNNTSNVTNENRTTLNSDADTSGQTTTTVSGVSSVSDSTSAITKILNIALIVVGILLIFLAIAILIRLKNNS